MRTRIDHYFNITHFCDMLGIAIFINGQWLHLAEDGKPLIYATSEECEKKRKELRKLKSLPGKIVGTEIFTN